MNYFNRIALMLVAIILTGCAASGAKYTEISTSLTKIEKGKGRIYFYRKDGSWGAGVQPNIKLNGVVVGESKPGGFFFIDQKAGEYSASTKTEVEKSVNFSLAAGEKKYIQTSIGFGFLVWRVTPQLVEKELAENELQSLRYTGAANPSSSTAQSTTKAVPKLSAIANTAEQTISDSEIQKVEFKLGRSSYVVGEMAKKAGCIGNLGAGLITEQGPVEVYRMNCDNDEDEETHDNKKIKTFMAKCEMRQCAQMK